MSKSFRSPLRRAAVVTGLSSLLLATSVAFAPAASNPSQTDGTSGGAAAYYSNNFITGAGQGGIATDGINVWKANSSANTVTKLTAATGALVGTYNTGTGPNAVATDGSVTWVANQTAGTVTRLNASTGALVTTVTVGTQPSAIAIVGRDLWVANSGSNNVTRIEFSTNIATNYALPASPVALAWDGALNVFIALANKTLAVCPMLSCNSPLSISLTAAPTALAVDGENLWVGSATALLKYRIAGAQSTLVGTFQTAHTVRGIAFDQPGFSGGAVTDVTPRIWAVVRDSYYASLEGFNAITGALEAVYPTNLVSEHLAFDGQNLWLTSSLPSVMKIRTR